MSFSSGSSGELIVCCHTPNDLFRPAAEGGAESVLNALAVLNNLILESRTPAAVCSFLFGAKLIAFTKENGGICPITVKSTIRRLASKCACHTKYYSTLLPVGIWNSW